MTPETACPIHGTPLNGDGACLPCDIASGMFDDRFEPGTPEAEQHFQMKARAIRETNKTIDETLKKLEE